MVKEGLILYKLVDGIQSDEIRDTLLRKGADLTPKKAINVCRADKTTNHEMKIIKQEIDTVESNTCRSNVQHLVKHAENVGKRITGQIAAMPE